MITQQPITVTLPQIQTYSLAYPIIKTLTSQRPKENTFTAILPDPTHITVRKLEPLGDNTLLNPLSGVGQTYSQISQ